MTETESLFHLPEETLAVAGASRERALGAESNAGGGAMAAVPYRERCALMLGYRAGDAKAPLTNDSDVGRGRGLWRWSAVLVWRQREVRCGWEREEQRRRGRWLGVGIE